MTEKTLCGDHHAAEGNYKTKIKIVIQISLLYNTNMGNHRARAAYPLIIRRDYNPSGPKRKGGCCLCILHILI